MRQRTEKVMRTGMASVRPRSMSISMDVMAARIGGNKQTEEIVSKFIYQREVEIIKELRESF